MHNVSREKRLRIRQIVLLVTSTVTVMVGATLTPALPELQRHFADTPNIGLLIPLFLTLPPLISAVAAPLAGYIADRFGRKNVLTASLVIGLLCGTTGLYIDSLMWLFVFRAILGITSAGVLTVTTALIADYYGEGRRQHLMGMQAGFNSGSAVLYLILGGVLADLHWRAPFAIYLLIAVLIPYVLRYIDEPDRIGRTQTTDEVKPVSGTRWSTVIHLYIYAFVMMVAFFIVPLKLPFLLEERFGLQATWAGFALAVPALMGSVSSFLYRKYRSWLSYQALNGLCFLLIAIGYIIIAYAGSYWLILAALVVGGLGYGIPGPNLNVWLAEVTPADMRGRIYGGLIGVLFIGQFATPFIITPIILANTLHGAFGLYGITAIFSLFVAFGYGMVAFLEKRDQS
jgi:MFS family permease